MEICRICGFAGFWGMFIYLPDNTPVCSLNCMWRCYMERYQQESRFAVYVTAIPFLADETMEESAPSSLERENLNAEEAMKLATECSKRCLVGRVRIICQNDDTISLEWIRGKGIVFPKPEDFKQ